MKDVMGRWIRRTIITGSFILILSSNRTMAADSAKLEVQSSAAFAGDTVDVNIDLTGNPGIMNASVAITYDPVIELTDVYAGDAFSELELNMPASYDSGCVFSWSGDVLSEGTHQDGTILTLTFAVPNGREGQQFSVGVSYNPGEIIGTGSNEINPITKNGRIVVANYKPGDVNGDDKSNPTDITLLRRYVVGGYDASINEYAGDVNGDEKINSSDITWLRRVLAGGYKDKDGNPLKIKPSPKIIDMPLGADEHAITYDIANGDSYLEGLLKRGKIENKNPASFKENVGLQLSNLSVTGYRFRGWFDGASDNATRVLRIEAGTTYDIELYAHWEAIEYTIEFAEQEHMPEQDPITYTINKGATLPTPKLDGYSFAGWSDAKGNIIKNKKIPVGTTGNKTYYPNWLSDRNQAWSKNDYGEPLIYEDDQVIMFTYEIGEVRNVPLKTIYDFGKVIANGIGYEKTVTYSTTTDNTEINAYLESLADSTTRTNSWTLSTGWNESVSEDQVWAEENGYTEGQINSSCRSESGEWYVSTDEGTSSSEHTLKTEDKYKLKTKTTGETRTQGFAAELDVKNKRTTSAKLGAEVGGEYDEFVGNNAIGKIGYTVNGKVTGEVGNVNETNTGLNLKYNQALTKEKGTETHNDKITHSEAETASNAYMNVSAGYSGSSSYSASETRSRELSRRISETYAVGRTHIQTEDQTRSEGIASYQGNTKEYSTSASYSIIQGETRTETVRTDGTRTGYHRWVIAGKMHVFGVVGYDIATKTYFTYSYSVMDDETHPYQDYSYDTASYDDNENSIVPFSIPYDIAEYVHERVGYTEGLRVNQRGVVTGYTGTDPYVLIPEYWNDAVKITAIAPDAFRNNKVISAVEFSDYITEIPDNAFEGCDNLLYMAGKGITKIGAHAFKDCRLLCDCVISKAITEVGEKAFENAGRITVYPANQEVLEAALDSTPGRIIINLDQNSVTLDDTMLQAGDKMRSFELNGSGSTFNNLQIVSDAIKTRLSKLTINSTKGVPLNLSSPTVELNQVVINSPGLGAVLKADTTNLGIAGDVKVTTQGENAFLSKVLNIYEIANADFAGELIINGKMLYCGDSEAVKNSSFVINKDNIKEITEEEFDRLLSSYTLTFDANGGTCTVTSKEISNGEAIGELPIPERENFTFAGWYLSDNTQVTSETAFFDGAEKTVYAHWDPAAYTANWNSGTGYTITVTRTASPNKGAALDTVGNGDSVYYGDELSVKYTASKGYTINNKGAESLTVTGNVTAETIYATATANDVTYNIVYRSSNGTGLGNTTVTKKFGTTNTISAPGKDGYNTPGAQTITWDSVTPKTITFTYMPVGVAGTQNVQSGGWNTWISPRGNLSGVTFSVNAEYQNRTANSVQIRLVWTNTLIAHSGYGFAQTFTGNIGGISTGGVTIVPGGGWPSDYLNVPNNLTATAYTGWITVPVSSTTRTVGLSASYSDADIGTRSWSSSMTIPTF